jgi:hypothetical protein
MVDEHPNNDNQKKIPQINQKSENGKEIIEG